MVIVSNQNMPVVDSWTMVAMGNKDSVVEGNQNMIAGKKNMVVAGDRLTMAAKMVIEGLGAMYEVRTHWTERCRVCVNVSVCLQPCRYISGAEWREVAPVINVDIRHVYSFIYCFIVRELERLC